MKVSGKHGVSGSWLAELLRKGREASFSGPQGSFFLGGGGVVSFSVLPN